MYSAALKIIRSGFALACAAIAVAPLVQAQSYTAVYSYGTHTGDPRSPVPNGLMAQGRDGKLYSTTSLGGATSGGAAFNITTTGSLTKLLDFASNEGAVGGLTLGSDGKFYGTTSGGGTSNVGTVFKLTSTATRTTLWNFTSFDDGANPIVAPLLGKDGNFYGVNPDNRNGDYGLVYKITTGGTLTVRGDFNFTNGSAPNLPVQGTDGNFYGNARFGGSSSSCSGCGVVYKMTSGGTITVLHNFDGYPTDGSQPVGVLVQANDGNLYGTTYVGGANNQGTVYKITTSGTYTLLYSFHDVGGSDGINPWTGLASGTDGNLYGTAQGGTHGGGVLFKITPSGTESVLYNFCSVSGCADGFFPQTPILQHTNGKFYGSVESGGANGLNGGVFYSLDMGLQPFAGLVTWQGAISKTVEILGQGFTGATKVSFNGTKASFTVVSDTYLTATVPAGATKGFVTVTTPTATLTSNRKFFVLPTITSFSPDSGPVGTVVTITGNNLTGATKVKFGGVKATSFTVNSDTQITATVPTAAATGTIQVTTSGGTATSATAFTVTP
ncbi:MAG: hypothetical protein DMG77_10080 [Acidobacteria bacterium]|nr:MAG: hypothetical protein DMG77_10080 [Acidobacteriota bacterium]